MAIVAEEKSENGITEQFQAKELPTQTVTENAMSYEIPDLVFPYELVDPHPKSTMLIRMSHDWLASHGVDQRLGPEIWYRLVQHNTPDILTYILEDVDDKEFLLFCKFMLVLYSVDTLLDDTAIGKEWRYLWFSFSKSSSYSCGIIMKILPCKRV